MPELADVDTLKKSKMFGLYALSTPRNIPSEARTTIRLRLGTAYRDEPRLEFSGIPESFHHI